MNYEQFCQQFGTHVPDAIQEGERYYLVNDAVRAFKSGEQRKAHAKGIYLGMGKRQFIPSIALLRELAAHSSVTATLKDEKAEWLFICGKNIFPEYYTTQQTQGYVLVQNTHNENLGMAQLHMDKKFGVVLKHILDCGNYLRHDTIKL